MADEKCPFCGSKEIYIKTPYSKSIAGEPEYTYCCLAQKKNHDFLERRNAPYITGTRKVTIKDVEKL